MELLVVHDGFLAIILVVRARLERVAAATTRLHRLRVVLCFLCTFNDLRDAGLLVPVLLREQTRLGQAYERGDFLSGD